MISLLRLEKFFLLKINSIYLYFSRGLLLWILIVSFQVSQCHKDLAYSYNKANEIDDDLVYGDEADESYDDEEHNSKSNSKHTSTDSKEDDDESVDDGDISRQEDEVERIKYQIAIKKKEKEDYRSDPSGKGLALRPATSGSDGGCRNDINQDSPRPS